ncbi:macro domain-containing protein [Vibrio scophthalmi]|uniref:type II toxin-antitoxin system antitoxin DNA ADP-ribosyl glycohydrolase DarG n=1 Tax=Vibrio TaxID=662 RepID=UPI00021BECFB|nr:MULTISPECIES: macro domain-containing protein [Vibrio]EGU33109.1 hypothetical protein VIBRN418_02526 [Vibrio sp. N418]MCY9805450.1 macro domain-containing protein [Vibrio scophthalmi]
MITYLKGDLFADDAEALINTVNTVGVMGKGLAYQFKERFPDNFRIYRDACSNDEFSVGQVLLVRNVHGSSPRFIINFPTKAHWRGKSKIEYIESGLDDLVKVIKDKGIKSVAIPALGSGLGGLPWSQVERVIYEKLSDATEVEWRVYAPNDTPPCARSLNLTVGRALLITALNQYLTHTRKKQMSELEAQCLLYILDCVGIALNKIEFSKFMQAPYSDVLHKALGKMDGDFLYLSGINKPVDLTLITLEPKVVSKAKSILDKQDMSNVMISKVMDFLSGYESKDGMSIVATTLWVSKQMKQDFGQIDESELIQRVSELISKYRRISDALIRCAYERLIEEELL